MVVFRSEKFLLTTITFKVFELQRRSTSEKKDLEKIFPKRTYFLYFKFQKDKILSVKGGLTNTNNKKDASLNEKQFIGLKCVRKRVIAFASSSSPFSGREIFVTFRSQSTFDHSRRSFYLSNGY